MLYFAILVSAVILYLIQMQLYKKLTTKGLSYHLRTDREEVRAGDDLYLYEELSNEKTLPLPFVKVNTDLPEGLKFHFTDRLEDGTTKETYEFGAQSIYVLRGYQKISRRWRITGTKRGSYLIGSSHIMTNDLFGMNPMSHAADTLEGYTPQRLTVLPPPYDLRKEFVTAQGMNGDIVSNKTRMTDPLLFAGTREYRMGDPMRAINWKSSAVHGHFMVNIEEPTVPFQFNIFLNTQSRTLEKDPEVPSAPDEIDRCITTAFALLERGVQAGISIRMMWNIAPKESVRYDDTAAAVGLRPLGDDEIAYRISTTAPCRTPADVTAVGRLLAELPYRISVKEENLLDHMLANPSLYTASDRYPGKAALIVVSTYFSERMLVFHRSMEVRGVRVIYYIMTTYRNAQNIPADIEVYYLSQLIEDNAENGEEASA